MIRINLSVGLNPLIPASSLTSAVCHFDVHRATASRFKMMELFRLVRVYNSAPFCVSALTVTFVRHHDALEWGWRLIDEGVHHEHATYHLGTAIFRLPGLRNVSGLDSASLGRRRTGQFQRGGARSDARTTQRLPLVPKTRIAASQLRRGRRAHSGRHVAQPRCPARSARLLTLHRYRRPPDSSGLSNPFSHYYL